MQKDDVVPEIRTFLASVSDIATDPVEREKRVADINAMFLGALLVPGRFVVRTLTRGTRCSRTMLCNNNGFQRCLALTANRTACTRPI